MRQSDSEVARGSGRRARTLGWVSVVLVVGVSLFGSVHPWYDPTNDGSMYIATARSLVAGEGYRYLGIPFVIRPPGFSLLIAPLLAWRGTDFHALNLLVSLFGALGVVAFHFSLRARLGVGLATLVPLVLWFAPGYQRLCNQVMSDVPGWSALLACLLLAARWGPRWSAGRALAFGLVLGLATLLRSGNLLLAPALVGTWLLAQRMPLGAWLARSAWLALGAALVLGPWALRNRAVAAPPPADQTLLYSYSTGMWHTDMGDPRSPRVPLDELLARVPKQGRKLLHTLGTGLGEGPAQPWTLPLAWILIAATLLQAVRRRGAEELFALATLGVVAVYFGYAGRLLLPVFAFALAALVELVRDGVARLAGARSGIAAGALVCLAWLAGQWKPRADWPEIEALHRAYAATAAQVNARLAPGARLGAWRGWHHAVFLERPVYSFEQACERAASPLAAETLIETYAIDTLLLSELGLPPSVQRAERAFAAWVAQRYGSAERGLVEVR